MFALSSGLLHRSSGGRSMGARRHSTGILRNKLRNLLIERLESRRVLAVTPILSEFLASNSGGLSDADGDSSDWIEVYNPTDATVDLNAWRLTDSASDLNAWSFPAVSLAPNQFLTVFASGKDRAVVGQELHTNFKLSSGGEFLALVDPSGTIVSEYTPSYPQQTTNVSYGARFDNQTLLTTGSAARTMVPSSGSLGATWQQLGFNDTAWAAMPVGIGFGVVEPGFDVTYYKTNTALDDLATALNVIATPALQTNSVTTREPWINYLGSGSGAHYGNDLPFPTQEIGEDINDFIVRATTSITVPTAGTWTFGVNSDDGFRLTLSRDGVDYVSEFAGLRGPQDTLTAFALPAAGEYSATLVMFERGGGASVELFAALGNLSSFNAANFDLVGDVASGGLSAHINMPAGPTSPLRTDISGSMLGVNASVYARVPFSIADPNAIDSLRLSMRYDDGFIAYINGVEVARRNAPAMPTFSSAATVDRTAEQAMLVEDINLSSFRSALLAGNNVLAIQGLNSSASDSSFLILPELLASKVFENDMGYFAQPTPGAPNQTASLGVVDRPTFTIPAGFYDAPITVGINTSNPSDTVRYTLDGSTPSETNGTLYTAPLSVSQTSTIRALAYRSDYISLPTVTSSYLYLDDIINQSPTGAPPPGWPASWGANVVDYGIDPAVINLEGATAVKNALKAIPTLNITTDLANLFDPSVGIYANAYAEGRDWERPASLELLQPDGSAGFQVNAGLRVRGGYSRSGDNPKHSFRLFFRGEYGDSSLDYPIAGPNATDAFEKIDLRTAQNYSWSFEGNPSNNFVADVYNRLSQQAMGQPSTSSQWYHLYLNGEYWGLYQTQERSEADYAASYFGGSSSDYDVVKAESGPYTIFATDGNLDAWTQLWTAMNQTLTPSNLPAVANQTEYMRLQGKNFDGTDNPDYDVLLDVDNLATYMIGILFAGNLDAPISNFLGNTRVNNFYAIRDRTGRDGFKFFMHDSEHTLRNVNENRNGPWTAGEQLQYSNPQWFHQRLMSNAEYRLHFADLVQKFLFYDGALSVSSNQARFNSEAAKIDQAIIAESARWGDAKRPDSPLLRSDWINAVNGVVGNYFPLRNDIVIDQFRNTTWNGTDDARLFPTVDAPVFLVNGDNQHGGTAPPNSLLRFGANDGTVYYTTDGSDPRLVGGAISPLAQAYNVASTTDSIFDAGSNWKYRDNGVDLDSSWRQTSFSDLAWASGNAEFGYGDGDEATTLSYGADPNNKYITTYFRKQFSVANVSEITGLKLSLKRDDGAVIYINGVEAARSNMPTGPVNFSTLSAAGVGGADETKFYDLVLDPGLLVAGNNLIAVEIHQNVPSSTDISFDAALSATRQTNAPIELGLLPTSFRVRTLSPTGEWSALEQAAFSSPLTLASTGNLIVSEVHYNPAAYTGPNDDSAPYNDRQNFEFIELLNTSSEVVLLDGVSLSGVSYTFATSVSGPLTWLLPGERIVLVKNQLAFAARYLQPGSPFAEIKIASGDYGTSSLSNGGEEIALIDAASADIQRFTYDDGAGWPTAPDGDGPSLTPIMLDPSLYNLPSNWRASFTVHGTPGLDENVPPTITRALAAVSGDVLTTIVTNGTWGDVPPDGVSLLASVGDVVKHADGTWTWSYAPSAAVNQQLVTITASDLGGLSAEVTFELTALVAVANRQMFYKGSTFADTSVQAALEPNKVLLQPSITTLTTSANNISNYTRGINGLVLDIAGLANTNLTAADFIFRVSPDGASGTVTPADWANAPAPTAINVTSGNANTPARIRVEWANNVIQDTWLQVVVKANVNTGLALPAVYYVGSVPGELAGLSPYRITGLDLSSVRSAISTAAVAISEIRDVDKSGRVSGSDLSAVLQRTATTIRLRDITVPVYGSAAEGASDSPGALPAGNAAAVGELHQSASIEGQHASLAAEELPSPQVAPAIAISSSPTGLLLFSMGVPSHSEDLRTSKPQLLHSPSVVFGRFCVGISTMPATPLMPAALKVESTVISTSPSADVESVDQVFSQLGATELDSFAARFVRPLLSSLTTH